MAHGGEEFRLHAVSMLSLLAGFQQCHIIPFQPVGVFRNTFLRRLALGDVADTAHKHFLSRHFEAVDGQIHRENAAVLPFGLHFTPNADDFFLASVGMMLQIAVMRGVMRFRH